MFSVAVVLVLVLVLVLVGGLSLCGLDGVGGVVVACPRLLVSSCLLSVAPTLVTRPPPSPPPPSLSSLSSLSSSSSSSSSPCCGRYCLARQECSECLRLGIPVVRFLRGRVTWQLDHALAEPSALRVAAEKLDAERDRVRADKNGVNVTVCPGHGHGARDDQEDDSADKGNDPTCGDYEDGSDDDDPPVPVPEGGTLVWHVTVTNNGDAARELVAAKMVKPNTWFTASVAVGDGDGDGDASGGGGGGGGGGGDGGGGGGGRGAWTLAPGSGTLQVTVRARPTAPGVQRNWLCLSFGSFSIGREFRALCGDASVLAALAPTSPFTWRAGFFTTAELLRLQQGTRKVKQERRPLKGKRIQPPQRYHHGGNGGGGGDDEQPRRRNKSIAYFNVSGAVKDAVRDSETAVEELLEAGLVAMESSSTQAQDGGDALAKCGCARLCGRAVLMWDGCGWGH